MHTLYKKVILALAYGKIKNIFIYLLRQARHETVPILSNEFFHLTQPKTLRNVHFRILRVWNNVIHIKFHEYKRSNTHILCQPVMINSR